MQIKYDIPKLKQIVNDIFILTGLSIDFLNLDGEYICGRKRDDDFCSVFHQAGENDLCCHQADTVLLERCRKSSKFESHLCHAGLYDAMTPVIKNDVVAGYVLMGRIRSSQSPERVHFEGQNELNRLYEEIPYFSDEQIASLQSLLQEILFEKAIIFDFDQVIDDVAAYVESELRADLKIDTICARFGISKNYLYDGFQRYYGVTVNEYVTGRRLARAKQLLLETKRPVYEICEAVGINNYTYFCKLFKKREGVSPGEFRKYGHVPGFSLPDH